MHSHKFIHLLQPHRKSITTFFFWHDHRTRHDRCSPGKNEFNWFRMKSNKTDLTHDYPSCAAADPLTCRVPTLVATDLCGSLSPCHAILKYFTRPQTIVRRRTCWNSSWRFSINMCWLGSARFGTTCLRGRSLLFHHSGAT